MSVVSRLCSAVLVTLPLFHGAVASEPAYPDKPVKIVVPFSAGGPTDIFARLVAKKLADDFQQQFAVENLGGAGGNVGTQAVVKSPADGYTLLFTSAALAIAPSLYRSLAYDPATDLAPIAVVGKAPMLLITHAGGPATAKELVEMVKASPDKYNYASAGNGSATHLGAEAFKALVKIDATHVPYRGTAPALVDVVAGRHLFIFDYIGPIKPYLGPEGRLRALAIASEERSPILADVPTFSEAGLPAFVSATWNMFLAPAGTPEPVLGRLNEALNKALRDPEVTQALTDLGIAPVADSTLASTKAFMQDEIKRWARVVETSGAALD